MPAIMMSPAVGSSEKVSGRIRATPATGPKPGSTPIAVPANAPTNAASKLAGVAATPGVDFDAERGHGFLRFCYAGNAADMVEAARRLEAWAAGAEGLDVTAPPVGARGPLSITGSCSFQAVRHRNAEICATARETDLMEVPLGPVDLDRLEFTPFEIKTILLEPEKRQAVR